MGEHLGDALELRAGHAGDALDLLGRVFLDLLADVVHAVDALLDELLVLPAVLEDVPEHAPDHRDVGARPQPHVFRGVRGGPGQARIGDDEIGPVQLLAFEQMLQRHRMRLGGIAAQEEQRLGVADVGVAVGHRAVAPGVGDAGDGGGVADARLVVRVVGAPERGELAVEIRAFVGEFGRAEPIDGIGAGLAADLLELVADLVDGGVPGDARPLPVHELGRIAQAAVAVHHLAGGGALGAVRAAVDRRIPARLLADPDAVDDLGRHRAADRAMGADVLSDGGAVRHHRAGRLGLADRRERQRADRGEAADGEARAAQEAAAVERALRLAGEGGGERAAGCLAFRSFDQHERLLISTGSG